ncbi:hypothetical protein CONLIGDRAFT_160102 [Coniochaeta ligniaria NRRL 30616]|uniref:Uncharacterized protein n=1 Tax=Coniochaeta ligniaria NRRL 30616 TaxID=1408157 RepID=A0A1J7J0E8_9PEZI|nr:hypothetical protein CONLIGDRAFT_160102 [Coniochaeta ligniaria NRRL 30616]
MRLRFVCVRRKNPGLVWPKMGLLVCSPSSERFLAASSVSANKLLSISLGCVLHSSVVHEAWSRDKPPPRHLFLTVQVGESFPLSARAGQGVPTEEHTLQQCSMDLSFSLAPGLCFQETLGRILDIVGNKRPCSFISNIVPHLTYLHNSKRQFPKWALHAIYNHGLPLVIFSWAKRSNLEEETIPLLVRRHLALYIPAR